uniref:HUN domain-containing protein n=1 Tax=Caenorhabditis tropicalis TaxID=1561998 RepID=A0A1I7UPS0_9PELO
MLRAKSKRRATNGDHTRSLLDHAEYEEPSYEELKNEMTNSESPKKKNVFKTIRGLFKKKKDIYDRKSVLGEGSTTDYGIVCYEDLDLNPALDLVDNRLATSMTDFSTKMDDAHSYVNLGYVGKTATAKTATAATAQPAKPSPKKEPKKQ